jgi:hypothetical protein
MPLSDLSKLSPNGHDKEEHQFPQLTENQGTSAIFEYLEHQIGTLL